MIFLWPNPPPELPPPIGCNTFSQQCHEVHNCKRETIIGACCQSSCKQFLFWTNISIVESRKVLLEEIRNHKIKCVLSNQRTNELSKSFLYPTSTGDIIANIKYVLFQTIARRIIDEMAEYESMTSKPSNNRFKNIFVRSISAVSISVNLIFCVLLMW